MRPSARAAIALLLAGAAAAPSAARAQDPLALEIPVGAATQGRFDRMLVRDGAAAGTNPPSAGASPSPALSGPPADGARSGGGPSSEAVDPGAARGAPPGGAPEDGPVAPISLAATETQHRGKRQVRLTWRWPEGADPEDRVVIERSIEGGAFEREDEGPGIPPEADLPMSREGFPWGRSLAYRLRVSAAGRTRYSNLAPFRAAPQSLCAPEKVRLTLSGAKLFLQWEDPCPYRGSRYRIEQAVGDRQVFRELAVAERAGEPFAVRDDIDPSRLEEALHYRLRASNSGVDSAYSSVASYKPEAPGAPTGLAVRLDGKGRKAILSWKAEGKASSFAIEASTPLAPAFAEIGTAGPDAREHVVLDFQEAPAVDLDYLFRVRAVGRNGRSTPSEPVRFNPRKGAAKAPPYIRQLDPSWTPLWSELQAYWPFDRPGGASSQLPSGTALRAKVGPAAVVSGAGPGYHFGEGRIGDAIELNADASNWLYAGRLASAGWQGTVMAWIRVLGPSGPTTTETSILSFRYASGGSITFGMIWGGGIPGQLYVYPGGSEDHRGTTALQDGKWHHVAWTLDGLTSRFYVDGAIETQRTFTVVPGFGESTIGGESSGTTAIRGMVGFIDEMAVWRTPLTSDQVQRIYSHQVAP